MKKLEKIIVIVILLLSLLAIGIPMLLKSNHPNSYIVIKVDNRLVKKISMNNSNESKKYDFDFSNHVGYVETENGKVRMLEMSKELCPNGICSKTGWINETYQSIVCLPNKITVTIEGGKREEIDVIP